MKHVRCTFILLFMCIMRKSAWALYRAGMYIEAVLNKSGEYREHHRRPKHMKASATTPSWVGIGVDLTTFILVLWVSVFNRSSKIRFVQSTEWWKYVGFDMHVPLVEVRGEDNFWDQTKAVQWERQRGREAFVSMRSWRGSGWSEVGTAATVARWSVVTRKHVALGKPRYKECNEESWANACDMPMPYWATKGFVISGRKSSGIVGRHREGWKTWTIQKAQASGPVSFLAKETRGNLV